MTQAPLPRTRPGIALAALLWTLLLAGCATGPGDRLPGDATDATEEAPDTPQEISLALPESEYRSTFNAVEQLLSAGNWMSAGAELELLAGNPMEVNDHAYLGYLQARTAFLRGDTAATLALLEGAREVGADLPVNYRMDTFRRAVLSLAGRHVESAQQAATMLAWLPPPERAAWKQRLWRDLQRAATIDLEKALARASDTEWIGWLHLALDVRTPPGGLPGALSLWLSRYPDHPAAGPLPGGMDFALQAPAPQQSVALLLPLSGRLAAAGQAILDGFLAAYYAARPLRLGEQNILILDSANYASANEAYDDAVARGVQIVVGPLRKSAVAELATRLQRPVPLLTLNRVHDVLPAAGSAMVQLSLSPEDEATTLAEAAFGRGARSAVVLQPAGPWGDKVARALQERWQSLGGRVTSRASYNDREDYSGAVQQALGIAASEARARRVRDILATAVEFTPRRRQDPDVVFLLSRKGAAARSIKPLLTFHYAGDLPVYALSSIYNGVEDERNRDLDGIHLVETPWLLGDREAMRRAIAGRDTGNDNYARLNALGADAYLVQGNFERLQSGPDALFRGSTGLLSMDPQLHIRRQLPLATFDGGVIKPQ